MWQNALQLCPQHVTNVWELHPRGAYLVTELSELPESSVHHPAEFIQLHFHDEHLRAQENQHTMSLLAQHDTSRVQQRDTHDVLSALVVLGHTVTCHIDGH